MPTSLRELDALSVPEKIQVVEELWDNIANASQTVPVTDWQKQALAERKARYLKEPGSAAPWPNVKAAILAQHE